MSSEERTLLDMRDEFPSLAKHVHLASHTLGAMPRAARDHASKLCDDWELAGAQALERAWLPAAAELSDTIARVIGAKPGTVTLFPNCSTALAAVASGLSFEGRRRKVVYDDLNFSTVHYIWQAQARHGAEICVVPSRDGLTPPLDELASAIDDSTLVVPVSHVQFRNGAAYDVHRLVERARATGALLMLDCYQSAGVVPLRLEEWGIDLACGGSLKWACGGPGAGWLYVRPELLEQIRPTLTGWLAHAEPFAFELGPMRYADDSRRLGSGMPAIPSVYTARAGWAAIERAGSAAIRRKSLRQTALIRDRALRQSLAVNTPLADTDRGGTVALDFPGAQRAPDLLRELGIFVDYRARAGLRVSPHFYTTDDEIQRFFDALATVRERLSTL